MIPVAAQLPTLQLQQDQSTVDAICNGFIAGNTNDSMLLAGFVALSMLFLLTLSTGVVSTVLFNPIDARLSPTVGIAWWIGNRTIGIITRLYTYYCIVRDRIDEIHPLTDDRRRDR